MSTRVHTIHKHDEQTDNARQHKPCLWIASLEEDNTAKHSKPEGTCDLKN